MHNTIHNKVLFVGFNDDYLRQVLNKVDSNFEISRVIYSPSSSIAENSKNTIFTQFLVRKSSIHTHYSEYINNSLSASTLNELDECRIFFNRTLDRVFLTPLSTRESDRYFYTLVEFWISFIKKSQNFKAIFFESSPHFPWDICLFFVAQHLNIQTYILRRTLIDGCVVFDEDFRYKNQKIMQYDNSFTGGFTTETLLNLYKEDSCWLSWSKSFLPKNKEQVKSNRLSSFVVKISKFPKVFIGELMNCKKTYFQLSKFQYILFSLKRFLQQRQLSKAWEINSAKIPSGVPLVYFPLHFQPERSTDPESSHFSQQLLAIKLLLGVLPEDWHIVVKEHPRQNRHEYPNLRRFNYRDYFEYQELFKLPRVVPVSVTTPSDELLQSCHLAASCTGSVLWESMLHGKPSISFGAHWHSGCKSSPSIYDIEADPSLLTSLLNKDEKDILADIEDFIVNNSSMFINASNSEQFAQQSKQDVGLLINNLSQAINYILKI
jgi:hypothetical protein